MWLGQFNLNCIVSLRIVWLCNQYLITERATADHKYSLVLFFFIITTNVYLFIQCKVNNLLRITIIKSNFPGKLTPIIKMLWRIAIKNHYFVTHLTAIVILRWAISYAICISKRLTVITCSHDSAFRLNKNSIEIDKILLINFINSVCRPLSRFFFILFVWSFEGCEYCVICMRIAYLILYDF